MNQETTRVAKRRRLSATARWSIRRWVALLTLTEAVLLVAAIAGGVLALTQLTDARSKLIEQIDPQLTQANDLSTALLDQETGSRGYLLTGQRDFRTPYELGRKQQDQAAAELRHLGAVAGTEAGQDLDEVLARAHVWQQTTTAWISADRPMASAEDVDRSKTQFDAVRTALDTQRTHLDEARIGAKGSLDGAAVFLSTMLAAIAVLLVILFALLYLGFRRAIARPILNLAAEVRAVSEDDTHRHIQGSGPRELVELAADVEAMRQRIVDEVSELHRAHELLDTRTHELQRSNSDLEQFAYVASHDLQEPLRKVASFCQLLERRYKGRLDDRGDQYIQFAVDGAKRMQALINDLLAFSRVGRRSGEHVVVETGELFGAAISNLEPMIADTGARITHAELPRVHGEATLLTAVFQNLINNAIKFRGEQRPQIDFDARLDDGEWVFSVTDNGIGIEPEYAERIFVIFQRLHAKGAYPGNGIGLAMCRKIVEYHGGRIWLDTTAAGPTRFCFTLPALSEPAAETTTVNEIGDT